MNIKNLAILGSVTAIGAVAGSVTTALIMTKECHKMMEKNKENSEKISKELSDLSNNVCVAKNAFDTYKEKIIVFNDDLLKMNKGTIEAFRKLSNEGKGHQEAIRKVSEESVEFMKNELEKIILQAELKIESSKRDAMVTVKEVIMTELLDDKQDKTDKMIDQIETDNGKKNGKKKTK